MRGSVDSELSFLSEKPLKVPGCALFGWTGQVGAEEQKIPIAPRVHWQPDNIIRK
jgi:hypothetical protein